MNAIRGDISKKYLVFIEAQPDLQQKATEIAEHEVHALRWNVKSKKTFVFDSQYLLYFFAYIAKVRTHAMLSFLVANV